VQKFYFHITSAVTTSVTNSTQGRTHCGVKNKIFKRRTELLMLIRR